MTARSIFSGRARFRSASRWRRHSCRAAFPRSLSSPNKPRAHTTRLIPQLDLLERGGFQDTRLDEVARRGCELAAIPRVPRGCHRSNTTYGAHSRPQPVSQIRQHVAQVLRLFALRLKPSHQITMQAQVASSKRGPKPRIEVLSPALARPASILRTSRRLERATTGERHVDTSLELCCTPRLKLAQPESHGMSDNRATREGPVDTQPKAPVDRRQCWPQPANYRKPNHTLDH